jgi:hypothetical protein
MPSGCYQIAVHPWQQVREERLPVPAAEVKDLWSPTVSDEASLVESADTRH